MSEGQKMRGTEEKRMQKKTGNNVMKFYMEVRRDLIKSQRFEQVAREGIGRKEIRNWESSGVCTYSTF